MRRLRRYGVLLAAAGLLTAGCTAGAGSSSSSGSGSGSSSGSSASAKNSTLTISNESGALWTCNFNPLNAAYSNLSVGFFYEPLQMRMPEVWWTMNQTADFVAKKYGISRAQQDEYALRSQQRVAAAIARGVFAEEIVPFKTTMKVTDKATNERLCEEFVFVFAGCEESVRNQSRTSQPHYASPTRSWCWSLAKSAFKSAPLQFP